MEHNGDPFVDFRTDPSRYRHLRLQVEGPVAELILDVEESAGLFPGADLKLNSYDLGVDLEIADAVQRLRFEHPAVRAVVVRSGKERVFCAGANIRMLASASHRHKVNFCKFTNETRLSIEEASASSGQRYIAVITGTAAGGGYEFALACDEIILVDDGSSSVSLPEVPLLAVLPGTGGLTRLLDKRHVRRDRADVFCTTEEGVKGRRAVEWGLVDEAVPRSRLDDAIAARVARAVGEPSELAATGVSLSQLARHEGDDRIDYEHVALAFDRSLRVANLLVRGPARCPASFADALAEGAAGWMLACARQLDDALLHLRFNEPHIATIVLRTAGERGCVLEYERLFAAAEPHWFAREVRLLWKRVLKRLDHTSRSIVALLEPGSCYARMLAELAFAADRSYALAVAGEAGEVAALALGGGNFGAYPMSNGLSRLETRFFGAAAALAAAREACDRDLAPAEAAGLGLLTFALDDIDWEDEVRLFLEERAAFSPDALTAMEANLRFPGPETMETRIFARLTAWQNWVFQRANAVGDEGALKRYGTGKKPVFDFGRV